MAAAFDNQEPDLFDVIILGASGFTGKFVLREFLQCLSWAQLAPPSMSGVKGAEHVAWPPFSLALAGRNVAKLKQTLAWAVETAPQSPPPESELRKIEFLEADALDEAAMDALCSRARVLVNCVGPCLLYGEKIVAACVKAGVHYLDISGEAEFMERVEVKYGERALESGALIVPACGSISSVSDLGLLFHLRQWPALQALPSSVDAYVRFHAFTCSHAASAETAFIALANADRLAHLRRNSPKKPKLKIPGRPMDKGKFVHHEEGIGVWATALPICDRAVVRRTFWGLHGHPLGLPPLDDSSATPAEREKMWKPIQPVHYRIFFGARQLRNALLFSMAAQLVAILATYKWGQKLLLRYPEVFTMGKFTKKGPSEQEMRAMRFEMWFVGRGYSCTTAHVEEGKTNGHVVHAKEDSKPFNVDGEPDVEVVTRVAGPDPAYLTTAINIVQSAMMCVHARGRLPLGGVLTTATAFGGSHLQRCLESRGLTFKKMTTRVGVKLPPSGTSFAPASLPFIAYSILFLLLAVFFLPLRGYLV